MQELIQMYTLEVMQVALDKSICQTKIHLWLPIKVIKGSSETSHHLFEDANWFNIL